MFISIYQILSLNVCQKAFFNKENEMKTVSGNKLSGCHAYAYHTYRNLLFVSNIISKTTSSV